MTRFASRQSPQCCGKPFGSTAIAHESPSLEPRGHDAFERFGGKPTNLRDLYLHNNDALGLPPEVLGPWLDEVLQGRGEPANATDILAYYFRR